jgi:hypothetical protein
MPGEAEPMLDSQYAERDSLVEEGSFQQVARRQMLIGYTTTYCNEISSLLKTGREICTSTILLPRF